MVDGAIRAKVPWLHEGRTGETIVQHDGAAGHEGKGTLDFLSAAGEEVPGAPIRYDKQSAQSPDCNKNDLCFFNSLQAAADKVKMSSKSKEVLMDSVVQAYEQYPVESLVRVDALQFKIYRCILRNDGGNQYTLPHSGIRTRQNKGEDVPDYSIPEGLVQKARATVLELQRQLDQVWLFKF